MTWTPTQQETLLTLISRRGERIALEQQLATLTKTIGQQRTQQTARYEQWSNEQADVDRLERLSWASIYYSLLNRHDEQLTKEQAEAQRARLDYDASSAQIDGLTTQLTALQTRLASYADVEPTYEQLMQQKEQVIQSQANTAYRQRVDALTTAQQRLTELTEAQQAGRQAAHEIDALVRLLDEACRLGNWDMFTSSSLLSAMKYGKLDDVRDQSERVGYSVNRFRAELADVHQQLAGEWTFDDGLTRFVDIFFDNVFTDFSVQRRIETAQANAHRLHEQINQALDTVTNHHETAIIDQTQRTHELRTYLEQA
ncbi:hypothetical protein ACAW74_27065 [Fibrella sp. WM1]|uniref:hypothetical protein n=1 Tax=Fibrella musci TaxID=3242485 RepID=UPI003520CC82